MVDCSGVLCHSVMDVSIITMLFTAVVYEAPGVDRLVPVAGKASSALVVASTGFWGCATEQRPRRPRRSNFECEDDTNKSRSVSWGVLADAYLEKALSACRRNSVI